MMSHPNEYVAVFIIFLLSVVAQAQNHVHQECPEISRPHTSRCDQYFRCALLPSKTAVWITTQCDNGLVYRHNLSACVVPDSDWECDLSMEYDRSHSEENVYGIDNLPQVAFPASRTPAAMTIMANGPTKPNDVKRAQYQLPTIAGDDRRGILILMNHELGNPSRTRSNPSLTEELESSGDGSSERAAIEEIDTNALTDNGVAIKSYSLHSFPQGVERESSSSEEQPPPMPLSNSYLNSFLEDYSAQNEHGQTQKGRLPLPANGKIHPEHLSQIINQQKQLNRIATRIKQNGDPTGGAGDYSPFTNKVVFSRKPGLLNEYSTDAAISHAPVVDMDADKTAKVKAPYVSEDIIKSILQISQQMIANHQKSSHIVEPTNEPEPVLKPTYVPFSIPTALGEHGAPAKPKITTTTFNSRPIGISFTNPYTLGHTALYDNLRNQPLNETTYYNSFQPTLYDIYGNRFVSKDTYAQVVPPSHPHYGAYLTSGPSAPHIGPVQPVPTYPSVVSPYVSPLQGPTASAATTTYSHHLNTPSVLQLQSNVANRYGVLNTAIDRLQPLDSIESDEIGINDSTYDSEAALLSNEASDESGQLEVDNASSDMDTTFKHKLFALGQTAQDYNQYKESILPLLDVNPNDVRISVATCTLGSREPNKTDCFKYFVCNPHNGAFQSFTCPAFTAFNKETRLCDTSSYQGCKGHHSFFTSTARPPMFYKASTPQTHLMKNDLLTAQKYVELMQQEANKLLTRNNMPLPAEQIVVLPIEENVRDVTTKPSVKVRRKSSAGKRKHPTSKPTTTTTTTKVPTTKRAKPTRKGIRCRIEGRIPNPIDRHTYYVCHRKSQKKFVKMKMTCPSGLVYCAASHYCTSHC